MQNFCEINAHECARDCPLKDAEQKSSKKPVITLIFKLKALVICPKFDLHGNI